MTVEEMQAIAKIISTADGGCGHCVRALIDEVNAAFPEFRLVMTDGKWRRRPEWADEDDYADQEFAIIAVKQS